KSVSKLLRRHGLFPFGKHDAMANAQSSKLAFTIGPVKVNVEKDFVALRHVQAKTLSAYAPTYRQGGTALHLPQQIERDFNQLIVNDVLPFPYGPQHQDAFIAREVIQRIPDESFGG